MSSLTGTNQTEPDLFFERRTQLLAGPWQRTVAGKKEEDWRLSVEPTIQSLKQWAEHPTKPAAREEKHHKDFFVFSMALERAGQIEKVMRLRKDSHWVIRYKGSRAYQRDRIDMARWLGQLMAHAPYTPSPEGASIERVAPMRFGDAMMCHWASISVLFHNQNVAKNPEMATPDWCTNFLTMAKALDPISTPWVAAKIYRPWTAQRLDAEAFFNGWAHEAKTLQSLAEQAGVAMDMTSLPEPCRSHRLAFPWMALNLLATFGERLLSEKATQNLGQMERLMDFKRVDLIVVQGMYSARDLKTLIKVVETKPNDEIVTLTRKRRI